MELLRTYKPTFIVLLEPKVSGDVADGVCKRIRRDHWCRFEAEGLSGGVWILWNKAEVGVTIRFVHKYFIHVTVRSLERSYWELAALYASPNARRRRKIWSKLHEIKVENAWALIGDFNCVLTPEERSSGRGASSSFAEWVEQRGLIDMGYSGPRYTWNHGTQIETRRYARLDRALSNDQLRRMFQDAALRHLSHSHSDHCPLLLQLKPEEGKPLGTRPFQFLASWLTHRNFLSWAEATWIWNGNLTNSLKQFSVKLLAWNKDTFGNIFMRKKRCTNRLEGVQRSLATRVTTRLLRLEEKLKKELNEILVQEEMLWKQKSRIEWLKEGDRNTKFFHTTMLIRRRRNRVDALLDDNGEWVTEKEQLKKVAIGFYTRLFTSELRIDGDKFLTGMFPPLNEEQKANLESEYTIEETLDALKSMGQLKAPGPDGFPAAFFQRTWKFTRPAVFDFVKKLLEKAEMPTRSNESLLILIPKEEKPSSMKGFRPISLCNVCVKLATKMLVNRLKGLWKEIISSNQGSFVQGRQSIDNVVVCQEVIHSLRYTQARRGGKVLKLDLEKAYDRLKWSFIKETLQDASLPSKMIEVIMEIIASSKYRLLWNGELTDYLIRSRGLRQGDPLSPLIFVICMQRFSHWIQQQENLGVWKAIRTSRKGPKVSHLFFADDILLFAEATEDQLS